VKAAKELYECNVNRRVDDGFYQQMSSLII